MPTASVERIIQPRTVDDALQQQEVLVRHDLHDITVAEWWAVIDDDKLPDGEHNLAQEVLSLREQIALHGLSNQLGYERVVALRSLQATIASFSEKSTT